MKAAGKNMASAAGFHFNRRQGDNINSVQNGLLLTNTIHSLFDNYSFSINPDVRIPNLAFSVKLQWLMIISGYLQDRMLLFRLGEYRRQVPRSGVS
jgi:HNH endonuclease